HVRLFHALPGQLAALSAQRIARAGEGFFVGKVRPAGRDPFIMRDDFVRFHAVLRLFDPDDSMRHPGAVLSTNSALELSLLKPGAALFIRSFVRGRHPADAGAARLGEDDDAADAWNVEGRLHDL